MKRYSVRQGVLVVIAGGALGLAALAALALPPGTAQADPAGNKAVVEQLITDVALNGDDALFEEIFADDFAGHLPPSTGDWAEVTKIQMRDLITLTTRALSTWRSPATCCWLRAIWWPSASRCAAHSPASSSTHRRPMSSWRRALTSSIASTTAGKSPSSGSSSTWAILPARSA